MNNNRTAYFKQYRQNNKERRSKLNKEWRDKNKSVLKERRKAKPIDKVKRAAYVRKRIYGLSQENYNALVILQNNRCAICFKEMGNGRTRVVDHSHRTGKVRGLLCSKCNTAIGLLNEDVEVMKEAIEYLNRSLGNKE